MLIKIFNQLTIYYLFHMCYYDEEYDDVSPTTWNRISDESNDDYEERVENQNDFLENLND